MDLGPAALVVALAAAVATVVLAVRGRPAAAGRALGFVVAGLSVALLLLARALVTVDGSLVYVADHTSRATHWPYRLAGLWGGMAGSLLLWTWMAALWALVAGRRVHAVAGAYLTLFCGLLVLVSQPFERLAVPALDGGGLNPVLLHPAMLYHPPLLYAGAVGLLVPFSLAVTGRADGTWLAPATRAAGVSLVLLSAGLLSGAHWAYVELGWGGYWAWDPVENGGLLPWLAAVAFLHAAVAARRQPGNPAAAAAGFAVLAFVLGLLGSFLTRSGATESVHAFGEARAVGWVLAGGLLVAIAASVATLLRRRNASVPMPLVLTANNAVLVALVIVVGLGTVFPLLAEWMTGDRVVVGGRYFAVVTAPLAVALLALLAFSVRRRPRPAIAGLVVFAALALVGFGPGQPLAVLLAGLAGAAAVQAVAGWRRQGSARWPLAHLGVAVLLAGVAGTTTGTSVTTSLAPGQEVDVRGYTLRLDGVAPAEAPDGGRAAQARVVLSRGDRMLATLRPEALVSETGQRVSVAALRSTPLTDVQVALRAVADGGSAVVLEVGVLPFMQLVWWGGLLTIAGLAMATARPARAAAGVPAPAPVAEPVRRP